jgi:ATP-dependent Clp protease protease subunit
MDKIEIGAPKGDRRDRFFARSVGTKFAAKTDDGATQIDLYDEIGFWGVTAKGFRSRLKDATGDIVLRINSPGGDVFDGIAIYNDLLAYEGKVKVEVVGVAASIASIIAMAGDEVVIAPNAFFMIHNAWTIGVGNRHDMTDIATTLGKIDEAMARTYAAQTTSGIRSIKQMMDDETWLDAKESVEAGFATSILPAADSGAKAKFDLSVFSNPPKALVWDEDDAIPETEEDVEKLLMRDAGKTRSQARALIRDIRAGTRATPEVTPGADVVDLTPIAEALKAAREAFHHNTTK